MLRKGELFLGVQHLQGAFFEFKRLEGLNQRDEHSFEV